ncbi:MAG: hypothetical protein HY720_07980 [Planctomycetes bacterium]|nr:hypothetical protein [Planctomycetota bacterium]
MNTNARLSRFFFWAIASAGAIAFVWLWRGTAGAPANGPSARSVAGAAADAAGRDPAPLAIEEPGSTSTQPRSEPDVTVKAGPGFGPSLEVEFGEEYGTLLVLDDQGRTEREIHLSGLDDSPGGEEASWLNGGSLLVCGLIPGKKSVVYWDGWLSAGREEIELYEGTAAVRLTVVQRGKYLDEAVSFHGHVVDREGYPIPGALARVRLPVTDPFTEGAPPWSLTEDEYWGAVETLLGSRTYISRGRLESDGFVTMEGVCDSFGMFGFDVPAWLGVPVEVTFVVGEDEWVRPMFRQRPSFGEATPDELYEEIVLEDVPPAFPGLAKGDRERYIFTLLGRIERAESARSVQESEEAILAWIRGLRDLPEHVEYIADLARLERLVAVVFDDLAQAEKERPVPGDLVLDVTAREEVIRRLVILVRNLLDFLSREDYEYEYERDQASHYFYSGMDDEEFERPR